MRPNPIRQALQEGRPTFGTHIFSQWPTIVEVVGHTGMYDYIEFSGEYAPYDLFSLDNFCRAAELHGMSSMMKLDQEPKKYLAQRAIGAGFQSVLFADIRSVEDVKEAVAAVRPDHPQGGGTYGAADRRAMLMYSAGTPRYLEALNEIVVAIMIEKASAVEQLDEILAVPGIDMVQWGPADYSMSLGRIGEWNHPDIKKVERYVFEKCLAAGVQPRLELSRPEDAAPFIEMGVRHFCMNADIYILHDWLKSNGRALRDLVEGVASATPEPATVGYRGANPGVDAVSPATPGSR
jgi:4-hydroxy-2-oxoheptanedioate aldolase